MVSSGLSDDVISCVLGSHVCIPGGGGQVQPAGAHIRTIYLSVMYLRQEAHKRNASNADGVSETARGPFVTTLHAVDRAGH